MTIEKLLISKIENEIGYNEKNVVSAEIETNNISLEDLKYDLLEIGKVIEEDVDNEIFVISIKTGFSNSNKSVVAIKYCKDKLVIKAFAEEGLIKNHSSEKAIEIIKNRLNNEEKPIKKKSKKKRVFSCLILVLVLIIGFALFRFFSVQKVTKEYNQEIIIYNEKVEEYNAIAKEVSVKNIEGFENKVDKLPKEDESFIGAVSSTVEGNTPGKIKNDIETLSKMEEDLQNKSIIMKDINNPSKDWVISKIKTVKNIRGIKPVTKENDISGLYNKAKGGFNECVYFISDSAITKTEDKKKDSLELGVDGGGAVEVYETLKEAKERCDYLKQFDGTILYSGSYALIGTMVVRTSCNLTDEDQYKLTSSIFESMTK